MELATQFQYKSITTPIETGKQDKLMVAFVIGGSYGARAKILSVDHYQKLIDRGWRR